ncbi:hypothetical protein AVEN_55238-1 [Araneus ventricosus]|uniref:Uncharacterized protein n=1 Tax=Araneus ventricosus TaxID=182803 RepID=A0A4Y2VDQ8_ARAVE|nr:hypothetical protein AVEN_55238-1 [Araneus ventricosus]
MTRTASQPATPAPNFPTTQTGGRLANTYDLKCNRTVCTTDLQWNRISNLGPLPPPPEVETLLLGYGEGSSFPSSKSDLQKFQLPTARKVQG